MDFGFLTAIEFGFRSKWQTFVILESSLIEVICTGKIGLAIWTVLRAETKFIFIPQIKSKQHLPEGTDFFFFFSGKLSCKVTETVDLVIYLAQYI